MKNYLNTFPIFNDLSEDEVELFIKHIKTKSYKTNDTIIVEGEEGDSLLFILDGVIIVTQALTLATNKLDEAEVSTRNAIKFDPNIAEVHNNLGVILNNKCNIILSKYLKFSNLEILNT